MYIKQEHLLAEAIRTNILPVTGRCNLSCLFCSHRYNPPEARVYDLPPLPSEKIKYLIDGLDPSAGIIIGESATRLREGEPFTHPHITEILSTIRERFPAAPVQITTNGTLLTPDMLHLLTRLQPIELVLSLNSITKKSRRLLMGDKEPGRVTKIIEEIAERGIPFHGSVVAMPNLTGWDDLAETLRFLESRGAQTIRLFIPGFTRFTPDYLAISSDELTGLNEFIRNMQDALTCPLLPEPPGITGIMPVIEGVIRNSPAAAAGLQRKDVILSVNEENPRCRAEAFNIILRRADPAIEIKRDNNRLQKTIIKRKNESSGITMHYDLDPRDIDTVHNHIKSGKNILLLTSRAAAPLWEATVSGINRENLKIAAVPSFFWGGSIFSAGLLTIADIRREIKKLPRNYSPEIVMLPPQAFDRQGLDLCGQSYLKLAELFPENVKLIT